MIREEAENLRAFVSDDYACWMLTTAERWRSPLVRAMAELAKAAVTERPVNAAA